MQRTLLKSKIHRATITEAELNYRGSITIDRNLMDAADILPFEKVQIVNINNGSRMETYVIEGEAGSGGICLNGPAARRGIRKIPATTVGQSSRGTPWSDRNVRQPRRLTPE